MHVGASDIAKIPQEAAPTMGGIVESKRIAILEQIESLRKCVPSVQVNDMGLENMDENSG
jgi:hypothetical protein